MNPDGTLKWIFQDIGQIDKKVTPVIDSDGTIYCGSDPFFAINPDGTEKWGYLTGCYTASSPSIGSDSTIYFGNGGVFRALNLDSTMKWSFYVGHTDVRSSPAIGQDGTIYFGANDGYFYAVQGSGQLANTPWPKFRHDAKNTGRFGGP